MARVGKEVGLGLTCLSRRFECILLFDLRLDDLILCDRAHDDAGKVHHRQTRIVHLRELETHIPERCVHVYDHYHEKDCAEICSVYEVEEKEHDRHGHEKQENARALRSACIKEEYECDPVNETLYLDGKVHQPVTFLFAELAD